MAYVRVCSLARTQSSHILHIILTRPTPALARACSNPPLVLQPLFDPLLGSNANNYCPCSVVVFSEQLNSSSGRCDDSIRNESRNILRGIAEAGQYVSVAFVAAGCRDTVSVIQDMLQKSANSSQVLGLYNLPNTSGASQNTSVAWGEVFREVGKTKKVGILDVSGMRGSVSRAALGDNVGRLANLQWLKVRNTDWRDPIPVAVSRLTQLRYLAAGENPRMVALPKGLLAGLSALTNLDVMNNHLTEIPSLEKNTGLTYLSVQNNHLTEIPSLEKNTGLETLSVQNNHLTSIPSLEKNTGLIYLRVQNNHLTEIPSLNHTVLQRLFVGNNSLQSSSAWPSPGHLPSSLKFLSVVQNQLVHIPTWVQQLPRLEYIDASTNNITSLDMNDRGSGNSDDAATITRTRLQGGLGRNTSLLLLGGNPVCGYSVERGSVWGSRWNVQCQSQCSSTCPLSIEWGSISSWLSDGICDLGCNNAACGYDRGDCDIAPSSRQ